MRITAGRARNDPEKAVLPAIVWTRVADEHLAACALSIGWWDFNVTMVWSRRMTNQLSRETGERRS